LELKRLVYMFPFLKDFKPKGPQFFLGSKWGKGLPLEFPQGKN